MKAAAFLLVSLLASTPAGAPPVARGNLKFSIASPPGQSVPREVAVRVRSTLGIKGLEDHPWEVTVASPVRDGECSCEIPAGPVDLRIQAAASMPVYRWTERVEPARTTDLGTLKLERGAAISGRVRTVDEKVVSHSVLVTLVPLSVGSSMVGLDPKLQRTLRLDGASRPWGFFRFDRVQPGRYVVLAQETGLPTARFGPIEIEGDLSFEIPEPIWITPLLSLDVQVDPRVGPDDRPWDLQLAADPRAATEPLRALKGTADAYGHWRMSGLAPGDYRLGIGREKDNWWKVEKIHLVPASLHTDVRVPFVAVSGRLTLRGEPVRSGIGFSREEDGATLFSDETGSFSGFLPQEGKWEARVTSAQELTSALRLDPVQVRKPLSGSVKLELRIQDTLLPVEVVDDLGQALPKASVNVLGKFRGRILTDRFGKTAFTGLKPGRQCLLAAHQAPPEGPVSLSEETAAVVGREGFATPRLRLVVPRADDIRGRVLPRYGFAPGALVLGWPAGATGKIKALMTTTDEDGDFRLPLPARTENANLAVLAPGNALRVLETRVVRNLRLDVHVDTAGGTLILDLPGEDPESPDLWDGEAHRNSEDPCGPAAANRYVTLLRLFRRWADLQGTPQTPGRLVVPNVEPGPYTLCATDAMPVLRKGAPAEGDPRCAGGVLEARGELSLKLPGLPPLTAGK